MKRNISIDLIKFFAVFLIINSHMDILYPKYKMLATGGAIGDVLFLFCSGYTLFLGKMNRFDNWYKKRINRIYPSVIICAIASCLFLGKDYLDIITLLGGEFVIAIMIYYIMLFFIGRYLSNYLIHVLVTWGILSLIVYIFFFPYKYEVSSKGIYGIATLYRWIPYFLFMLLGAIIGKNKSLNYKLLSDSLLFIFSLFLFYGIQLLSKYYSIIAPIQIVTVLPLLGVVFYFYKICNAAFFSKIYKNTKANKVIMFVSGICLESYLIQNYLFTDKMNSIFPLNLLIMILIIICVSFIMKIFSRIFIQTFQENEYDWKSIFKLY